MITYNTGPINSLMIPIQDTLHDDITWVRDGEPRRVSAYVIADAARLHIPVQWDQCVPIKVDSTVKVT